MERILKYLNNYFYSFGKRGEFEANRNVLNVKDGFYLGQYIKVCGSNFNDGVYRIVGTEDSGICLDRALNKETFNGVIFGLKVPKNLQELNFKIESYIESNSNNNFVSESFGDYSYTRTTGRNGGLLTWQEAFREELKPYRKMYDSTRGVKIYDI